MLASAWRSLPSISRGGLTVVGVGVIADLVHHMFTRDLEAVGIVHIGLFGHVVTLAGMVLTLIGVVSVARTSRRRARQKGESNGTSGSAAATR